MTQNRHIKSISDAMMNTLFEDDLALCVLGSGSKGNASVVRWKGRALLIDAGLAGRDLLGRLSECGLSATDLCGVILTHEHGDHCRGLRALVRAGVPVFAHAHTLWQLRQKAGIPDSAGTFEFGQGFTCGPFLVRGFAVPHDAAAPCGFVIVAESRSLALLTDLGFCPEHLLPALANADAIILESNYDEALLSADAKRPWSTKQRIMAPHGHLSNHQAAQFAASLASHSQGRLRRIVLAHLSSDCNKPDLAVDTVQAALGDAGFADIQVCAAQQDQSTGWMTI